jgi:ABC-type glycerol-3-phosphate transport system permease component
MMRILKAPGSMLRTRGAVFLLAALVVGSALGPMLWAVSTSLKSEVNAVSAVPSLIPSPATLANYVSVFSHKTFMIELWNSILYAGGAVAIALTVGIPAGYVASRYTFPGKRTIMLIILATSMVPGVALLVPTFYLLDHLGLLNNRFVLLVILASRIAPQTVWFMQNFIDAVPVEIDEAAHMDGASRWETLTKLVLPLIRPGIAAVAVIGAITTWNDYITVAVFAPDTAKRTLQVALVNQVFDAVGISWSFTMAFALVASLPVILMFLVVQKWFIAGLTAGAVKG